MDKKTIIIGITGASGSPYAVETLKVLLEMEIKVHLISSPVGKQVWKHENGFPFKEFIDELQNKHPDQLVLESNNDLGGKPASGSFRHNGMLIIPCSMKCMAAVANGFASNLIERSADVCMKERFPLVLVTRETPLNLIHIENMAKLTRAGAVIMPASPGFYHLDRSLDGMVKFVVGKALDMLGITDHGLFNRWKEASN